MLGQILAVLSFNLQKPVDVVNLVFSLHQQAGVALDLELLTIPALRTFVVDCLESLIHSLSFRYRWFRCEIAVIDVCTVLLNEP